MLVSNLSKDANWPAARQWAWLAVLSLTLSGLAPLILIAGRASIYAEMDLVKQWFTPVLVIHVNLSVGLWFVCMMFLMQMVMVGISPALRIVHRAAAIAMLLGILAFASAPLLGGEAFTSNYIPVQNNPLFFVGLGLVMASVLLMALQGAFQSQLLPVLNALTLLAVLACFCLSAIQHPNGYGGEGFYESVFWAGGHVLQIAYVQLGIFAWMILAKSLSIPHPPRWLLHGVMLALWANAMAALGVFWLADVNDGFHQQFFTQQMIWLVGPLPALVAAWYTWHLPKAEWRRAKPVASALLASLVLFWLGGGIGALIEGSNTIIPAHYHGSTVGITLALMGVMFALLPQLKGRELNTSRWAMAQPLIYGAGQVMHVIGLAIAGGHNIQRKTAGALDASEQAAAAALQVMRLGGLLAVIGGGLFVVLVIMALRNRHQKKTS